VENRSKRVPVGARDPLLAEYREAWETNATERRAEGEVERVEELIYFCIPSEVDVRQQEVPPRRYGLGSLIWPDDLANFK
jgi:hypothetical protein